MEQLFELFEELPQEIQRVILSSSSSSIHESRTISKLQRDILYNDFINNPSEISVGEMEVFKQIMHSTFLIIDFEPSYDISNKIYGIKFAIRKYINNSWKYDEIYLMPYDTRKPVIESNMMRLDTAIIRNSIGDFYVTLDLRSYYTILKFRSNTLKLNIDNDKLKFLTHEYLSTMVSRPIFGPRGVFLYLYLNLKIYNISLDDIYVNTHININTDPLHEGLLESLLEKCRNYIDSLR